MTFNLKYAALVAVAMTIVMVLYALIDPSFTLSPFAWVLFVLVAFAVAGLATGRRR